MTNRITPLRPNVGRGMPTSQRLRIIAYILGVILVATFDDGHACHVVGLVATGFALVCYLADDPRFFRLAMMWCAGYLLIVAPEGMNDAAAITAEFGGRAYDTASRCLVASHLMMLLGHDLVFSERIPPPSTQRWALRLQVIGPILIASTALSLLYFVPQIIQTYQSGRAGAEVAAPSMYAALTQAFATSASIAVPIISVWTARRVRGTSKVILFGLAAFFVIAQFMLGTRFLILFTTTGCAITWMAPHKPRRRTLGLIFAGALTLAIVSSVLSQTRTYGLERASAGDVVSGFSVDSFVMHERVVWSMAQAVLYTDIFGFTDGRSTAEIAVFWVPRAVWPNKPTLMGYWLPRAFTGDTGFSEGFSSAPGFTGTTYVDFGVLGSAIAWLIGGLLFGLLERRVAGLCTIDDDARTILIAPLYGGTFFAVRSIDTSILVLTGVYVFITAILLVASDKRTSKAA